MHTYNTDTNVMSINDISLKLILLFKDDYVIQILIAYGTTFGSYYIK